MAELVRLPTAHDIARQRIKDMPTGTIEEGVGKMLAYMTELDKARQEKERGEWVPLDG